MLTFIEETHEYFDDGVKLPSVTEICKFAHAGAYANAVPHLREVAAMRGTMIHEATVELDINGEVEVPPELTGYINAYIDFKRDYNIKSWGLFEHPVGSKELGYAGTLDRAGCIDDQITIVDLKTGTSIDKLTLLAQLCGYKRALPGKVDRLMGVQLKKDGKYTVYDWQISDIKVDPFGLCYELYQMKEGLKCRKRRQ